MAISAVPPITRCSCSTNWGMSSAAPYGSATCTAPMAGAGCWNRWWRATRGIVKRLYFRGDAAFANRRSTSSWKPSASATIRLPANRVLQDRIGYLLKRPIGRPRRYFASIGYQAKSWNKQRRVVAKLEWHPDELYPRVGFVVTNLARPAERVVVFYNQRGTAEQWIKEGKGAIKSTRLSCRAFAANAVRLQLHALAYNLGNFMRTEGKGAIKWTRLSCRTFAANAVRLQLHALAYNLGNFMRTLALALST
jgi:hypothetical protein